MNSPDQVAGLLWGGSDEGIGNANDIQYVIAELNITINKTPPTSNPGPSPSFISGGSPLVIHEAEAALDETPLAEVDPSDKSLLQEYEQLLLQTAKGRALLETIKENMEEVFNLVNHNRRVMVTWRRKQGPAFLAAFAKSGEDPSYRVPQEINGISMQTMLKNMAVVLEEHGSERLQLAIREYALEVFNYIQESDSLKTLLGKIKQQ